MRSPTRAKNRQSEEKILIPAPVALVLSALVPGLGQMLAGKPKKGLLILCSVASILGLLAWRIRLLAHREPDVFSTFTRAAGRAPFFMLLTISLFLLLWIWTALDAYALASRKTRGGPLIFIPVLVLFFSIGWQISEIDLVKAAVHFPATLSPLGKILWPWEAAINRETRTVMAGTPILVEGEGPAPEDPAPVQGEPHLSAEPNEGRLAVMDDQGNIAPGTTVVLTGRNFAPDAETQIWWTDAMGNDFRPRQSGAYVMTRTDSEGSFVFRLELPFRLTPPSASGRQIHRVEARQYFETGVISASEPLRLTISLIIETIFMGMMATIFGIVFSIPLSFLASRNLMSGSRLSVAVYYLTRTVLNIVRAIEPLIWALIAVVWVGLGPFAGILALTIHSIASLAKLYSEAIENIDHGQIEAVQATGATRLQTIVYAVIPQMIPPFVSFTIYRWDINVRMSTIIGMVGGGGVGFLLVQYIRLLDYRAAGIAVWFIAVTVAILDYVSAEIRNRFV